MTSTNIVSWMVDGQRVDIDLFDIDGIEWRDAKRATGMTQGELVQNAIVANDIEAVGAFLWLFRRREDPKLEYETVLRSLTFGVLDLATDDDEDTESADPPG